MNLLLFSVFAGAACAGVPSDTLKNIDIEEAVVVASPKETNTLRRQAVAVSLFDETSLERLNVTDVKGLSTAVPNFYMPEYGSKLTSAVYIRGVGSRINTPAVGLYVDNVPYLDKSAYDFNFLDVTRVDVLRGPQGTLYGRNTPGGLIRVYTADPLVKQGTDISAGFTTKSMARRLSAITYLHPAENLGISVGAFYNGRNGYFTNHTLGQHADGMESGGGRTRLTWKPSHKVKVDWTASFEQSYERACPYRHIGDSVRGAGGEMTYVPASGEIEANRQASYRRQLFNTGLGVEHRLGKFTLSSITAYQYLRDRLFMDQDFIAPDIYTLEQRQKMHSVTEEISLKSPKGKRVQWTSGIYAGYTKIQTDCPVVFQEDGIGFLNRSIGASLPSRPAMGLTFTDNSLAFLSDLETPSFGTALFQQLSFNDLLVKGLSLTLGLRLDYDHRQLDLSSQTAQPVAYNFNMSMGPMMNINHDFSSLPQLAGTLKDDYWQLLPKFALQYSFGKNGTRGNVYAAASKGCRSGGYNIQAYSDLAQQLLRREMMLKVKDFSINTINGIPRMPDAVKQNAIAGITKTMDRIVPDEPDLRNLSYKPEQSWNYEAGTHLSFLDGRLQADLAAFYMQTRDQQLAQFSESGLGRVMVNAGKSRSCGIEASLRTLWFDNRLSIAADYGFTEATFENYDLGGGVDYTDNRVPFVPRHTMTATAYYRQPTKCDLLRSFTFGARVKGAGDIMWDEANTFGQDFYAQLDASIEAELKGGVTLTVRGANLTDTRANTFAFLSMNRRFAQDIAPRHFSFDIKWHF